ncbi:MAG: hypothetical protein WC901_05185 [Candidatus Margulisiibacteriota bacterium]
MPENFNRQNPEEEIKNLLSSLKAKPAPKDFLETVHARLEKRSILQNIIAALFLPLNVKLPLELAGAVATLIFMIFIFNSVTPQIVNVPQPKLPKLLAAKAPAQPKIKAAPILAAAMSPKPNASPVDQPIEIALVLTDEDQIQSEGELAEEKGAPPSNLATISTAKTAAGTVSISDKQALSISSQIQNLVNLVGGKVNSIESNTGNQPPAINAEIPADKFELFLKELKKLGKVNSSAQYISLPNTKIVKIKILLPQ